MSSFKPYRRNLLSQLLSCLRINYTRSKANCGPQTFKLQDFWSTSTFRRYIHHFINGWSLLLKECPKFIKTQKLLNKGFLWKVNQTLTKHNFSYFIINFPSNAHFEEDAFPYNSSSSPNFKICTHKKIWIRTL